MPWPGVITFDCYGTLIDWETGIARAFQEAAGRDGVRLDRAAILARYAEVEPEVQAEAYRPYREVLAETARRVAAALGWSITLEQAAFLPESLPGWQPFPDTTPALERLAARARLGILSNVDDDLLAGTFQHFPVSFPLVVTAQQVRSYKPAPGHFLEARRRIDREAPWVHAAQSYFHDVVPARRLGLAVLWVNRKGEAVPPGGVRPTWEVRDLGEAVARLEQIELPVPGAGFGETS